MKMKIHILLVVFCYLNCLAAEINTRDNTVSVVVPDDWVVIGSQTKPPKTVVAFQIPNKADEGTPDSSNLSISTFEVAETNAMQQLLARYTPSNVVTTAHGEWTVRVYRSNQEQTEYVIRDAFRRYGTFFVMVRLAWPHLKANPSDYDDRMGKSFVDVLNSISVKKEANQVPEATR